MHVFFFGILAYGHTEHIHVHMDIQNTYTHTHISASVLLARRLRLL